MENNHFQYINYKALLNKFLATMAYAYVLLFIFCSCSFAAIPVKKGELGFSLIGNWTGPCPFNICSSCSSDIHVFFNNSKGRRLVQGSCSGKGTNKPTVNPKTAFTLRTINLPVQPQTAICTVRSYTGTFKGWFTKKCQHVIFVKCDKLYNTKVLRGTAKNNTFHVILQTDHPVWQCIQR